ncbi:cellulose synthase [Pusillimonas sp. CC-YST705]|uniref:Cellulose synthase n=1 Tax=Mesopusillimonas faecipullorum TaxID=2755040 RepID=A0ABS8CER5_9BURK|nr:cellulose biosynthesis protein BcsD [Mesopusillimonas faecipullorum]MCB5364536.1 cellulose synthase [Mesopusillimonas faecipullorum]
MTTPEVHMEKEIIKYLSAQQCSVQWRAFLEVFSQELTQQLTVTNLRGLMRRSGERFANQHPLPATETIAALQEAINVVWRSQNWGGASIVEDGTRLIIKHYLSPLQSGMPEGATWASGFLEGVYEQWMHQSGADLSLHVTQSRLADDLGTVEYSFGK